MAAKIPSFFACLVAFVVPLALVGLALRILLTPLYYTLEYNMPYFPADEYGFTKTDRLKWAPFAVNYLLNNQDISYLGQLRFDDGSPLFNERELSHMEDVKILLRRFLRGWYVAVGFLATTAVISWRSDWMAQYLGGLRRGGWWMIGLAVSLGLIAGAGSLLNPDMFWQFFTGFHKLFFEGNSWLFYYSDTLIRLFPIRFWQDAILAAAVIALAGGLGLAFGMRRFVA